MRFFYVCTFRQKIFTLSIIRISRNLFIASTMYWRCEYMTGVWWQFFLHCITLNHYLSLSCTATHLNFWLFFHLVSDHFIWCVLIVGIKWNVIYGWVFFSFYLNAFCSIILSVTLLYHGYIVSVFNWFISNDEWFWMRINFVISHCARNLIPTDCFEI